MSLLSPPILYVVNDPLNADKEIQLNLNAISFGEGLTTAPIGVSLGVLGFTTSVAGIPTTTDWTTVNYTTECASALLPNGIVNNNLVVGDTVRLRSIPVAVSARECEMSAGDDAVVGEHFGIDWTGAGQPFIMNTLDATDLQIRDTTLQLEQTTGTPQTTNITATDISIVGGNSSTWANIINNVGGGIPSINQVLFVGQNASNQPIIDLNGIGINGGTNLYNNSLAFVGGAGVITDLLTINGVAYPPPTNATIQNILTNGDNAGALNITNLNNVDLQSINGSAYPPIVSVDNLTAVLTAGNNASGLNIGGVGDITLSTINGSPYPFAPFAPYGLTDTLTYSNNASNLSMTNINNIDLITINGSSYPPASATQDLTATLGYGNSAGSNPINMNSQDIQLCNDITLVSINSVPFLPAKFSAVFPSFNLGSLSNNSTNYGGTNVIIPAGNYQITYTIQLDGNITQGGGSYFMVRGYCFIYGNSFGIVNPFMVNSGYMPTQTISYSVGGGYYNCLTATDYISITNNDTFQLGAYQSNEQGQTSSNTFLSAVIQSV